MVIDVGGVEKIIAVGRKLLGEMGKVDLLRVITWTLYCLLSGKLVPTAQLLAILPDIQTFSLIEDVSLRKDLLWILAHMTDNEEEVCKQVVELGIEEFAFQALRLNEETFVMPAVRMLGNIVSGDNVLTHRLLELGLLDVFLPLVQHRDYTIRKEVQWTLSNITAGTSEQRDLFLTHAIAREALIGFQDPAEAVRLETSWVYHNLASAGTEQHILALFDLGIILLFRDLFRDDPRLIRNLLIIIYKLLEAAYHMSLRTGNSHNPIMEQLVASGCYLEMEKLMQEGVGSNSEAALQLLDTFFSVEGR